MKKSVSRRLTKADLERGRNLSDEDVESQARLLWKERERHFAMLAPGAALTSWDEAPEEGRELLREDARAGKISWLDETPDEALRAKRDKAREKARAKNPREFAAIFRDEFPDRADKFSLCIERYLKEWFEEWFAGMGSVVKDPANRGKGWSKLPQPVRPLNGDRWVRDVMLVAMVFLTEHRFQTPRAKSCELVTKAVRLEAPHGAPLKPLEVEALAVEHAILLGQLREIAALPGR
jgi:hypothetical protein